MERYYQPEIECASRADNTFPFVLPLIIAYILGSFAAYRASSSSVGT